MKRIRYSVAMSLDGYISGPNGEADWITFDPEIDFATLWAQFDAALMGRRTYEAAVARLGKSAMRQMPAFVLSRTMKAADHPEVTVVPELTQDLVAKLKSQSDKDIWLFGGGEIFRQLMEMGAVDAVEVNIIPVLLGGGTRLLPEGTSRAQLRLTNNRVYARSGIVSLSYEVAR
jgi:dihydrofolate reductase